MSLFFFYDSFFSPCFLFISITFLVPWPFALGARRRLLPSALLSRTRGGERRERCGCDAGGTTPAPGTAGGGGWRSAAKVGHQQPRGMAGAGRQEYRNASVPAPVLSLARPLSCLGCPGEPQRAMAAWGLLPVGGWCWRSPGPSPCSFPCAWPAQLPEARYPTRQPSLRRGHQPCP